MLEFTGFVQVDIGTHVINILKGLLGYTDTKPEDTAPLDAIATWLQKFYSEGVGQSLAAGIAFTNSGFAQASWNDERFKFKREAYANLVLRGHQHLDLEPILKDLEKENDDTYHAMVLRGKSNAPACAFTGQPAYLRVSREMVPMLNGRGTINFSALGVAGLPVSDVALLAIHAMPLGCIISEGRLLAVSSDDHDLEFQFVSRHLAENLKNINKARQMEWKKLPNQKFFKTHLIEGLVEISVLPSANSKYQNRAASLTAYHFSNSGTDPKIDIYTLPSSMVDFVRIASKGKYQEAWQRIVRQAYQESGSDEETKFIQRNHFYEDIFSLPDNARDFIRTYFLRQPLNKIKNDVRSTYSWQHETDLISWDLTDLFLRRVMNMEQSRIDNIRALGDRLADHIGIHGKNRLLENLYNARTYAQFRSWLVWAIHDYSTFAKQSDEPLVKYDVFINIFEETEDFARHDWRLAHDLLMIRIFEQLHQKDQLKQFSQVVMDEPQSDETVSE